MEDLAERLDNRVQLTTDGHMAYLSAVEGAFGNDMTMQHWLSCMALHHRGRRFATVLLIALVSRKRTVQDLQMKNMFQRLMLNDRT